MSKRVDTETAVALLRALRPHLKGARVQTLDAAIALLDPRSKVGLDSAEPALRERYAPQPQRAPRIYFLRVGDHVKIGISSNPWARVNELRQGSPIAPEMIGHFPGSYQDEKAWHKRFAHLRGNGEWFRAETDLINAIRFELRSIATEVATTPATEVATTPATEVATTSALSSTPPIPPPETVVVSGSLLSSPLKPPTAPPSKTAPARDTRSDATAPVRNDLCMRRGDIERIFSERRAALGFGSYRLQHSDYDATGKAIEWAQAEHAADPLAAIGRSVAGFLRAAKGLAGEANGFPYTSWSKDPARWYAVGGDERPKTPEEHADAVRALKQRISEADIAAEMAGGNDARRTHWERKAEELRAELERLTTRAA